MSSTGRGKIRNLADFYKTPSWCVRRFVEAVELPDGPWLEPCVGDGSIVRASGHDPASWVGCDIRPECEADTADLVLGSFDVRDFLSAPFTGWEFKVVFSNPPFKLAEKFVRACLPIADHVVMLLRLSFIATAGRAEFMQTTQPDVYVLPSRPSFTGGTTDSCDYAWFHWHADSLGIIRVLATTPAAVRAADAVDRRQIDLFTEATA